MNVVFEENGKTVLATSSGVPGVMIVPPGKTMEDAKPVTDKEFKKILQDSEAEARAVEKARVDPIKDLTNQLAKLQSDIETLKQKPKGV